MRRQTRIELRQHHNFSVQAKDAAIRIFGCPEILNRPKHPNYQHCIYQGVAATSNRSQRGW